MEGVKFMAKVGDIVVVGSLAPVTGRYKHSACANTIIINKGEKVPPCSMPACPNKGAHWILQAVLT